MSRCSFVEKLKIGDQIDVESNDEDSGNWFIETIVNIEDDDIVTKCMDGTLQTLYKFSKRIAPLNTHTINVINLRESIESFQTEINDYYWNARHAVYHKKTNTMFTTSIGNGILRVVHYDMNNDEYKVFAEYETTLLEGLDAQTLNPKTDQLYIFAYPYCTHHEKYVLILDLQTATFKPEKRFTTNNDVRNQVILRTAAFTHKFNQFEIFDDKAHYQWKSSNDDCIHYESTITDQIFHMESDVDIIPPTTENIVYVKSCKKLLKFCDPWQDGGFSMFYCNYDRKTILKWISIPNDLNICYFLSSVLVFDHIILVFAINREHEQIIFALDVLHNKIFQDEEIKQILYFYDDEANAIIDENKYIHLIESGVHGLHYKFDVFDIIPKSMKKFYENKNYPTIVSFIKHSQRNNSLTTHVPRCLVDLILLYFPLFL